MANELSLTGNLSFAKGRVSAVSMQKVGVQFNVTGTNYARGTQTISTGSFQALNLGGVATPGYLYIQNNDATNFVTIAESTSGTGCIKIKPGEFALFRCDTTTPAAEADTASVVVEYMLVEA